MLIKKQLTGVCPIELEVILNNGIVNGCRFVGGCDGQGKALNALIAGQTAEWVVLKLKDVKCGKKKTSCAAELAQIVQDAMEGRNI